MGIVGWFKKKAEEAKQAQERARAERERRELEKREAEERERQLQLQQLKAEHQRKENILAILNEDKLPDGSWASSEFLPFKFQKSEHLIYVFDDVEYLEKKVKREIVGRTAGASFRVAKGVSIRTSGSRGTPVEKDVVVSRGIGTMAITTKHLYFNGQRSFRIPFSKMVSVEPYDDAVSVTRDRASALPEYFLVGNEDATFAYQLLQAVPSLEVPRKPEFQDPERYHLMMLQGDGDDMIEWVEE